MHQLKSDLICEIIRNSQSNLLEKRKAAAEISSDEYEKDVTDWVCNNARNYREHFCCVLENYSFQKLSEILKELSCTNKDLEEIVNGNQVLSDRNFEQNSANPESD